MAVAKHQNGRLKYAEEDRRLVVRLHDLTYTNFEIKDITGLSIFSVEEIIESKALLNAAPKKTEREKFVELAERVRAGEMIVPEEDYAHNVYVGILEALANRERKAHHISKHIGRENGVGPLLERLKNDDRLIEYDKESRMYGLTEDGRRVLVICPKYSGKDIYQKRK